MLSPSKRMPHRRTVSRSSVINDENMMPFQSSTDASISLQPSELPSSPLVSNSFLYNLPDPTIGLPKAANARLDILPSPFKRSAITSLNKPLSREQTQQLETHKAASARATCQLPASAPRSPSKSSFGAMRQLGANLDAPGGLPTPPSSSEFLTTTPGPSNRPLTSLPREPVSPSPSRSRTYVLSPARVTPARASTSTSTPRASQRSSASQTLRAGDEQDSDEDDVPRSANSLASSQMRSLPEIEEDSDAEEEEEKEEEEEIQLLSFKRGGPDATFIREIKENGWDQPLPPSPIKFTYLEPDPPRPPRQSSVGIRARSQSRSKTPQIRASPAPSQASRASTRARSVRGASATAAEGVDDISDESIKSSGTALTLASRGSRARSNKSFSSMRSARSSVAPPAVIADLTRDHPSLPDSPGDDPLLLTGPDTYVVYHDQTPSAKNRSTSRISKAAAAQTDASLSMHSHSTPLPAAGAAAAASSQRRDSVGSASSSASRNSLYTRMSGKQPANMSALAAEDDEEDDSQRTEHAEAMYDDDGAGAAFLPFDDAGFASDSDQDEPAAFEHDTASPRTPPLEGAPEEQQLEEISSMSDVSRSFADDSAVRERDQNSGPVDVSALSGSEASGEGDDSAVVDQSLHVAFADQSIDASAETSGHDVSGQHDQSAAEGEGDQPMDTSAADQTAEVAEEASEEPTDEHSQDEVDASVQHPSTELSSHEESGDVSAVERSIADQSIADQSIADQSIADQSIADQSIANQSIEPSTDASINDASAMLSDNDQSQDVSSSVEDAVVAENAVADASMATSDNEEVDRSNQEAEISSDDVLPADDSIVADVTVDSEAAQDSGEAAEDSRAPDNTNASADVEAFEHDASVEASAPNDTTADVSRADMDDSVATDQQTSGDHTDAQEGNASTLPVDSTFGSINLDISLTASERASVPAAAVDRSMLPRPVVLIESLPEDSSAILAWRAHQARLDDDAEDDIDGDFTFEIEASRRIEQSANVSMADASRSVAGESPKASARPVDDSNAVPRSESMSSILSAQSSMGALEQDEDNEEEEALRRKYQDSREIALNRRANLSRRLSLSTDSEAESDAEEQPSISEDEEEDEEDEGDAENADASSQRPDASHARSTHSIAEEDQTDEQEDEEEVDEEGEDGNESAISHDAASSGEEHDDEEEEDEEDEEDLEDDLDEEANDSQLEEDEQSGSLLDPVVIISSSASPSGVSTSALESEDEEEEEAYVVKVVRDPRDRSLRASEHSAFEDEPQIHTLHLRQPAPRPSTLADDTHRSQTLADASHSRSRVLKLGQPTSTPIVEISSLDPRAAARATAILKLFHKYVDEGWISGAEMGDATEGRMRRVVDAIQRAEQGRRLEDASELQQSSMATEDAGADLTTLLMDAELSLAREGTADTESFLASRATSVVSQRPVTASPATPFLPGGFRATPASARMTVADSTAGADRTASPSIRAASRSMAADASSTSTVAHQSKRKHPSSSFTFPGLSTPDRTRVAPAKQARLSAALVPPTASTFNPRIWDTADWVRLDKYFTSGVKAISSALIARSGASRAVKASAYADALLGIDTAEIAELFLDEMRIDVTTRTGEWEAGKVEARLLALQRKYLRKVESKYPAVLRDHEVGSTDGDESIATEDLDWSLTANTTAATQEAARGAKGRVSFGTPYRMGAHSTPAAGLLKKATSRAARERIGAGEQSLYPPLPSPPSAATGEGVMTKATRLISRLSGGFGGLLASPRPAPADKGKRKATEAELEVSSVSAARRRVDDSVADRSVSTDSSEGDSLVESMLSTAGVRSTINASMMTNATSVLYTSTRPAGKTTTSLPAHTSRTGAATTAPTSRGTAAAQRSTAVLPQRSRSAHTTTALRPAPGHNVGRTSGRTTGLTSSLNLAGGSSGVSHTPLSLLSPATHRVAAAKVEALRQSRAARNWTSPRRAHARVAAARPSGADSSGSGRDGSLAGIVTSTANRAAGAGTSRRR